MPEIWIGTALAVLGQPEPYPHVDTMEESTQVNLSDGSSYSIDEEIETLSVSAKAFFRSPICACATTENHPTPTSIEDQGSYFTFL